MFNLPLLDSQQDRGNNDDRVVVHDVPVEHGGPITTMAMVYAEGCGHFASPMTGTYDGYLSWTEGLVYGYMGIWNG